MKNGDLDGGFVEIVKSSCRISCQVELALVVDNKDMKHLRDQGLGSTVKHGVPFSRILLVDDDLLELERARSRGIQVYAAPEDGVLVQFLHRLTWKTGDIVTIGKHIADVMRCLTKYL